MTTNSDSISQPIPVIDSIEPFAQETQAWLVDIWGVMHNGIEPFPGAVAACERYRNTGGCVILLSNSPRPREGVVDQLDQIGVPFEAWDAIITSGDVTRELIHMLGQTPIYHLGPERDLPIFEGLDVSLVPPQKAQAVVCTGLFDDTTETAADYAQTLTDFAERDIPMICANPDIKVERGDKIVYCAGALAQVYASIGGKVTYAGKPYLPIYHMALARIEQIIGMVPDKERILAIGDGVNTDIKGAIRAQLRAIFVASGVHVTDKDALAAEVLEELFPDPKSRPIAAMTGLEW